MELKELCMGRMLPPVDIEKKHYDGLFNLCVEAVSEATGVPVLEIMGRRRPADIAEARMMVYKMSRHEIGTGDNAVDRGDRCPSLQWIGDKFGRDHGSVLHGVNVCCNHLSVDKKFYAVYIKALNIYEINRGMYLSREVKKITNLQIHALQSSIDTIKNSIKEHEDALAKTELMLEESKGGLDENMVQEQCSSNGRP